MITIALIHRNLVSQSINSSGYFHGTTLRPSTNTTFNFNTQITNKKSITQKTTNMSSFTNTTDALSFLPALPLRLRGGWDDEGMDGGYRIDDDDDDCGDDSPPRSPFVDY